jgi:hypothetical protein
LSRLILNQDPDAALLVVADRSVRLWEYFFRTPALILRVSGLTGELGQRRAPGIVDCEAFRYRFGELCVSDLTQFVDKRWLCVARRWGAH